MSVNSYDLVIVKILNTLKTSFKQDYVVKLRRRLYSVYNYKFTYDDKCVAIILYNKDSDMNLIALKLKSCIKHGIKALILSTDGINSNGILSISNMSYSSIKYIEHHLMLGLDTNENIYVSDVDLLPILLNIIDHKLYKTRNRCIMM